MRLRAVNVWSQAPERHPNWPYEPGLVESGVLHQLSLALTPTQVTKQHGPSDFCMPWILHAHIQVTKRTDNTYGRKRPHPNLISQFAGARIFGGYNDVDFG
jgi:hypothetical protein